MEVRHRRSVRKVSALPAGDGCAAAGVTNQPGRVPRLTRNEIATELAGLLPGDECVDIHARAGGRGVLGTERPDFDGVRAGDNVVDPGDARLLRSRRVRVDRTGEDTIDIHL